MWLRLITYDFALQLNQTVNTQMDEQRATHIRESEREKKMKKKHRVEKSVILFIKPYSTQTVYNV